MTPDPRDNPDTEGEQGFVRLAMPPGIAPGMFHGRPA
jgi:hypothetical protein